jgi:hypothetical protein
LWGSASALPPGFRPALADTPAAHRMLNRG